MEIQSLTHPSTGRKPLARCFSATTFSATNLLVLLTRMTRPARWIATDIPARLDRLPWSRWHWLVVIGLGVTWLLDGLEVTLAGSLVGMLRSPKSLGLSEAQVGFSSTWSAASR